MSVCIILSLSDYSLSLISVYCSLIHFTDCSNSLCYCYWYWYCDDSTAGYQSSQGTAHGDSASKSYNRKVRRATMKYAMLDAMNKPCKGFEDVIAYHFKAYKSAILQQVTEWDADEQMELIEDEKRLQKQKEQYELQKTAYEKSLQSQSSKSSSSSHGHSHSHSHSHSMVAPMYNYPPFSQYYQTYQDPDQKVWYIYSLSLSLSLSHTHTHIQCITR
jgi:hypothetical protein